MKHFSGQIETQSTCRYAQGMRTVAAFIQTLLCDHWLDSCLACSSHSNSHTSIFCIWVVLVELLYCYYFSPRCKSGLDFAWLWALVWLRQGLNESKYKMQTKAISNVWTLRLWQIQGKLCAIPDNKILANQVQKIRFNAACWSNHRYVTCGCHFNAVSYFVLWYFLICPTSSIRLLWLNKPHCLHCAVFKSFCSSQRLLRLLSIVRSTFSDKTVSFANRENWLQVQKKFRKSGNHNYVKELLLSSFSKKKALALMSLLLVTPLDVWVFASTVHIQSVLTHCFHKPCGKAYGDYNVILIMWYTQQRIAAPPALVLVSLSLAVA